MEQHFLMERLNEVLGLNWSWTIQEEGCEYVMLKTRSGEKPGQRAWCRGRLTILLEDDTGKAININRDGVGEKEMFGNEDARKGAASCAFRHASKFFTTFLWKGEAPASAPAPTVPAPAPIPMTEIPSAQAVPARAPAQAPAPEADWMARVGEDWDNVMGGLCEHTHMMRSDLEKNLWLHGCKFEDTKEPGRWVMPNTKAHPTFKGFALDKPKWALKALKEAQACLSMLQEGRAFDADVPEWNGSGHTVKRYTIEPRHAKPAPVQSEFPDEIPF